MQSKATTVNEYLAELPDDRRAAIAAVRKVILKNLDRGYEEGMQYGMIGYYVPHRIYPPGYHCDPKQPLPFVSLASQKNYMSLYLMCIYDDAGNARRFQQAWAKTGKKLNMGMCCVRFKRIEDLALDVIGEEIKRMPVKKHIEHYERVIKTMLKRPVKTSAKVKKPAKSAGRGTSVKTSKKRPSTATSK